MSYMSDYYELAIILVGLNPENDKEFEDEDKVLELLEKKYGIEDFDNFEALIEDLMPLIAIGESPITKKTYKGFLANGKTWACKIEVKK